MRTLGFILKEGLSGFRRAKFSTMLTLFTVAISVYFVGLFYVGSRNAFHLLTELKIRVGFEAFLDPAADAEDVARLRSLLGQLPGVDSLRFVSREEALRIFRQLFQEDYLKALHENPLPASFQIYLQPGYIREDSIRTLAKKIESLPGIDGVVYRERVLQKIMAWLDRLVAVLIGAGAVLGILSFVLVSNNIRLTMLAKKRIVETMQLVGATRTMVMGPFVVQGFVEGILGGAAASLLVLATARLFGWIFAMPVAVPRQTVLLLAGIAGLYGIFGALLGLRRQK